MNINYNDSSMIVKYLQEFLYENYSHTVNISGKYDNNTHTSLISYLNLPVVSASSNVYRILQNQFPDLFIHWTISRGVDEFKFNSKPSTINYTSTDFLKYLGQIENQFKSIVNSLGWRIEEYPGYDYDNIDGITSPEISDSKFEIKIRAESRRNIFPNRDLLCMINQFNNGYYYSLSIYNDSNNPLVLNNTETSYSGRINFSEGYKLAIIPCIPDYEYTIGHGYNTPQTIYVGSSSYSVEETSYVQDVGVVIENINRYTINSGGSIVYRTAPNAKNIVIQMTYDKNSVSTINSNSDINRLLIISGNYSNSDIGIPFNEFILNPWTVHEKFISYLLEMSITQYSDKNNIAYLQNLVSKLSNYSYKIKSVGLYDDNLRSIIKQYQNSLNVSFALGLCDVETEALILLELDKEGIDYD